MDFETLFAKTPATLDEIKTRVAYALERHPLCRNVQFDIVSMPRSGKGGNWTISLQSIAPDALWAASEIVPSIQEAYDLAVAARSIRARLCSAAKLRRRGCGTVRR